MMASTLTGMAAASEAVTATRDIPAARHRTGATLMIATGVGPRTFRQHAAAHRATPARPLRTTVRLIPGFRWLHSCSFHDSADLGGHLPNAGTGFSTAAALRSSLYYHGTRRGKK